MAVAEAPPGADGVPFWRFENKDSADPELWIYADIGFSWWDDGITAMDFAKELSEVKAKRLTVRINSRGGDVFDGVAIANLIREHPATVTVKVDALAASIASVIAMAGDTIVMGDQSQMMIHDASGFSMGNAADMRETADLLDMISDNIAGAYAKKAGGDAKDWRKVMQGEKWYTAQEAVDAGLADELASTDDGAETDPKTTKTDAPSDSTDLREILRHAYALAPGDRIKMVGEPGPEIELPEPTVKPPVVPVQMTEPEPEVDWTGGFRDLLVNSVQTVTRDPEIDVSDWRDMFDGFRHNMPEAPSDVAKPVDLGPMPEPKAPDPEPQVNPLAELISGATRLVVNDQPAPDEPVRNSAGDEDPPPFRLDVSAFKRSLREARF
jgi:ATP-dependent protease ClpP protease subunit